MAASIALPRELISERSFTIPQRSPLLLLGEGTNQVAHDLINHLITKNQRVVVADASNRFNVYAIVRAARQLRRPSSEMLAAVRVSRAFTWQQYVALVERQVAAEAARTGARWILALGPLDLFADSDVNPTVAALGVRKTAQALATISRSGLGVIAAQEKKPLETGGRLNLIAEIQKYCDTVVVHNAQGEARSPMARR